MKLIKDLIYRGSASDFAKLVKYEDSTAFTKRSIPYTCVCDNNKPYVFNGKYATMYG